MNAPYSIKNPEDLTLYSQTMLAHAGLALFEVPHLYEALWEETERIAAGGWDLKDPTVVKVLQKIHAAVVIVNLELIAHECVTFPASSPVPFVVGIGAGTCATVETVECMEFARAEEQTPADYLQNVKTSKKAYDLLTEQLEGMQ